MKQQERRFGSVSRETLFSAETGRGSFLRRNEVQSEIIIFFCGALESTASGRHTAAYVARRRTRAGNRVPCAKSASRHEGLEERLQHACGAVPEGVMDGSLFVRCLRRRLCLLAAGRHGFRCLAAGSALCSAAGGGRERTQKKERTRGPLPVRCGVQERNMPSRHGRPDGCSSPCRFCINVR